MKFWKAYRLDQALRHRPDDNRGQQAATDANIATLVAVAEHIRASTPPAPHAEFVDRLALRLAATPPTPAPPKRKSMLRGRTWPSYAFATTLLAILCLGILVPHGPVAQFISSPAPAAITPAEAKERVAVAFTALVQPHLSQTQQQALVKTYVDEVHVAMRILPPSELPTWINNQRHQILALEGRLDATMITGLPPIS